MSGTPIAYRGNGSSGWVGPLGSPSPQMIAPKAAGGGTTLAAVAIEVGAIFAATIVAGVSDSSANLMLALVLTLWVLRLVHHYST